jgi:hypothetical protein
MQIGGEGFENLFVNMELRKNFKRTWIQENTFPCVFICEWANLIPI